MKKNYLDNDEFETLLEKRQNNTISQAENEKLGEILMKLHQKISSSACFKRFDEHTRQDMMSHSLVIVMKSLGNWKREKGKAFSYFTASCFYNMFSYLKKEKKLREKFEKYKQEITDAITNYHQISNDDSE